MPAECVHVRARVFELTCARPGVYLHHSTYPPSISLSLAAACACKWGTALWTLSHVRAASPVFSINVDVVVVVILVAVCASRRSAMAPCRANMPRSHGGQGGPRGRAAAGTGYDVISWWVCGLPLGICAPTGDPRTWVGSPLASSGCCNCGRRPKCMPTPHAPAHASPVAKLWTHWDLSPGPSACEADVIPLHHVPHASSCCKGTYLLLVCATSVTCGTISGNSHFRGKESKITSSKREVSALCLGSYSWADRLC